MSIPYEVLDVLSVPELKHHVGSSIRLPKIKKDIIQAIQQHAPINIIEELRRAALKKADTAGSRKRVREEKEEFRKRLKLQGISEILAERWMAWQEENHRIDAFLNLPDAVQRRYCYQQFYDATSAKQLKAAVCAVCARECMVNQDQIIRMDLSDVALEFGDQLRPMKHHPEHELIEDMLLEPAGIDFRANRTVVNICDTCLTALKHKKDVPPALSLANGLWMGRTPEELARLTFAEQLLLSTVFPRVFVVKLYPKSFGSSNPDHLQRGLRGTISSYKQDLPGIAEMLKGNLMPQKPSILASILRVTFIGKGKLPLERLQQIFRVRRRFVLEGLIWLKRKNRYYGNYDVCEENLQLLPEDGIPTEIVEVIHQSEDEGVIDEEHGGYVPEHEAPDNVNDDPDVVPIQFAGSADTNLTDISATEMLSHGLLGMWKDGREGTYAVRRGNRFVPDYPDGQHDVGIEDSNFFEKAFPCLFPYGEGGLERKKGIKVTLGDHVRWALQYHDKRFRKHHTFPFVAFSIKQRRESLQSARLHIRKKAYERHAHIFRTITVQDLKVAGEQELQCLPVTNEAVRLLKQNVFAVAKNVQGSDAARYALRSRIWSTSVMLGPPYIWITINPSDLNDPIVQVLAGENINIDDFLNSSNLNKDQRAKNVADDPYAAAKFFHFIVQAVLEHLFQIRVRNKVHTGMGVLGEIRAYFGTCEVQGRGTLHLHILLWPRHAPSGDEILELLKSEAFRERMRQFIKENIRAWMPGLDTAVSVSAMKREPEIAFSRPINPCRANWEEENREFERRLARTEQVHQCKERRCLVPVKGATGLQCKRRAPFPRYKDDVVDEDGHWGPKRLHPYINAWNPAILTTVRCNNDIKLITNGGDARNITYYITKYATKEQTKTHNLSAILAQGLAFHESNVNNSQTASTESKQALLMYRLLHEVSKNQELAAPLIMSYLMGWNDHKASHTYTDLYWGSFQWQLLTTFPLLKRSNREISESVAEREDARSEENDDEREETGVPGGEPEVLEEEPGTISLEMDETGRISMKSQVTDYALRPDEFVQCNVLTYFMETYEKPLKEMEQKSSGEFGAPASRWGQYLVDHPRHSTKCRVLRQEHHRNIPNFVGKWFPRRDDEDTSELYCASVLMLLKPWRNISGDLKREDESWRDAYETFMSQADERSRFVLSGLQYFHDCQSAAIQKARSEGRSDRTSYYPWVEDPDSEDGNGVVAANTQLTEDTIRLVKEANVPYREQMHAILAVHAAKESGIFSNEKEWTVPGTNIPSIASSDYQQQIERWKKQMEEDVRKANEPEGIEPVNAPHLEREPDVIPITEQDFDAIQDEFMHGLMAAAAIEPVNLSELNTEQRRAYDLVVDHLAVTLQGERPEPLRMILSGEGGTGKSKTIQTITDAFSKANVSFLLVKSAYTGVAASLIAGKTTHNIACMSTNSKVLLSQEGKAKLQKLWQNRRYLIIDEYSMLSKTFLRKLSRHISIGCLGNDGDDGLSFGGLNVVLCGDLHQFPPVACSGRGALYFSPDPEDDDGLRLGRAIYEEFKTVVILRQQMRITDSVWQSFLKRLRNGSVTAADIEMLKELVINKDSGIDFTSEPWNQAALVTPRHRVREQWNALAVKKWCSESGERLYICNAHDTIRGRDLDMREKYVLAGRDTKKDLPEVVELARGMKVMVTTNLETDLDITNGARGTIIDIVLDPREPDVGEANAVKLKFLPVYILVKLDRTRASKLDSLDEGVIPIFPRHRGMTISIPDETGQHRRKTVERRQFPVVAAYAFTDYRSQGQTIPYVLVDLATPPTGGLPLVNIYVALSRSRGRHSIRLLRDFDEEKLFQSFDDELIEEDRRLERLDAMTKRQYEIRRGRRDTEEITHSTM